MPDISSCPRGRHRVLSRVIYARRASPVAITVSLAAFALPAHAQIPENGRTIVVTAIPDAREAETVIERTPGAVDIVTSDAFEDTPVKHIKDILEYVPGVIVQPRMGDDARLSVRGSGLSRAYGARGIALYVDGIPLNTSDGLVDLFEIDPSAYRYVEMYKGANALRYGANTLGGAINLVTPTGRDASPLSARIDAGSFGYVKGQASSGGASGSFDYFATVSAQRADGYREHSDGDALRGNLNLGYRVSPDVETRIYVYGASTDQRIPGEVSKAQALDDPRAANPVWVAQDQQRNVDSIRVANRTTVRLASTTIDLGAFYNARHVDHPIYQYLDYTVDDYGGFVRAVDDREIAGLRNELILGANLHNGMLDTDQFLNVAGEKGELVQSMEDRSSNLSFYAQDSLYVRPDLALIAGVQYLHAECERRDRLLTDGDQSGDREYDVWSPRVGLLWNARADWQVFANISRSAEVPSYDAGIFPANLDLEVQRATTYEIGTRGRSGGIGWDLALYRSELRNELQCLITQPWALCSTINADRTVHQGIEAGLDATVPLSADGDALALVAAYTLNDFQFDDDPLYGDNELTGVPRHFLRAEMLYRHSSGAYAGPNVEWAPGDYFADNANALVVGSYALLNLKDRLAGSGDARQRTALGGCMGQRLCMGARRTRSGRRLAGLEDRGRRGAWRPRARRDGSAAGTVAAGREPSALRVRSQGRAGTSRLPG